MTRAVGMLAFCVLLVLCPAASAWEVATLHEFAGGGGDGQAPQGGLILDGTTLYGMTYYGGDNNRGTIFSIEADGTGFTLLHEFSDSADDGRYPIGSLTLSGSTLYGLTVWGGGVGYGSVFSMQTNGSGFQVLHDFDTPDGEHPHGNLVLDGSTLYGMACNGGGSDSGTVFKVGTDGNGFEVLHEFEGDTDDGAFPVGSLTLSGTTLYGMTDLGGTNSEGVIFSIGTDGSGFELLHDFDGGAGDGLYPSGSLLLDGTTLYGMTSFGGTDNEGVIFSIGTDGNGFSLVHEFAGDEAGEHPSGNLTLDGSALYGMTVSGGANDLGIMFSVNTDGSGFTVQHDFAGGAGDGERPGLYQELTQGGSLPLYGMTRYGGADDYGVVFVATPEPSTVALLALSVAGLALYRRRRK